MARSRPRPTIPERLTDRVRRLLGRVEALRNELAKERLAHADTRELWQRQHVDLQRENTLLVDSYQVKVGLHQKEIGEKNKLAETLRGEINSLQHDLKQALEPPQAFNYHARMVVPLKYWADDDLMALLHRLERAALLEHEAEGIDEQGQPTAVIVPFPFRLQIQVTQEVGARQLTPRPHTTIALAVREGK